MRCLAPLVTVSLAMSLAIRAIARALMSNHKPTVAVVGSDVVKTAGNADMSLCCQCWEVLLENCVNVRELFACAVCGSA
jgi:hypothetical protein